MMHCASQVMIPAQAVAAGVGIARGDTAMAHDHQPFILLRHAEIGGALNEGLQPWGSVNEVADPRRTGRTRMALDWRRQVVATIMSSSSLQHGIGERDAEGMRSAIRPSPLFWSRRLPRGTGQDW